MKKKSLKHIVFTGVATGLLAASPMNADTGQSKNKDKLLEEMANSEGGNFGYHLYTEEELLEELNPDGIKLYNSLSPEGKRLARVVASSRCDHQNECSGLNACKSDKNDCQGKGNCKGQGKCAIADKNVAVELVAKKMAKKRADTLNNR